MKIVVSFFLSLVSFVSYSQTTQIGYSKLTTDYLRPGGSFQHWGTSDFGAFNATPTIPAGNTVPLDFYMRLNWTDIESTTTQGTYSWTIFDNAVNQAIDNKAMFHMAVMDMCSACGLPAFGYPTYLHNLMQAEAANSRDWQDADGVWVPNWNSPNYIGRYTALMQAVANHIATTSHNGVLYSIAFTNWDGRSYGDFGEGHTYPWTGTEPAGRTATSASLEALEDAAATAFPNVYITFPFAYQDHGHNSVIPLDAGYYFLTKTNTYGLFGLRRDNWGDDGYGPWITASPDAFNGVSFATLMTNRWKQAPWTGEPANDLNGTSRCGSIQCDLINEINAIHGSQIGNGNYPIPTNDPTNGAALVTAIQNANKILGNKLVIDTSRTTTNPSTGGTFNISTWWKNLNVAPIYEKRWKVIYELRKTSDQSVVWRDTSKFKPYLFLPQATDSVFNDNFLLTGVPASTCDLHVWIKDTFGYMLPYPLANTGRQTDGSYILRASIPITTSGTPVANAGSDQTISLPSSSVTLDGSNSSGTLTTFAWTKISGPNNPSFTSPASITTSVTGLIQGTYVFQLSVNGGVSTDQVTIVVNAAPSAVANAGNAQTIVQPTSISALDGSGSTGTITTYAWTFISGPSTPVIVTPSTVTTNLTGLTVIGNYVFQLSVNGGVSTSQVTITVNAQPSNGVHIFTSQVPVAGTGGPDQAGGIELGVKFKSSVAGYITGVRFYKTTTPVTNSGTHTGELYTAAGVRLASAVFTAESASGWQTVSFTSPVVIVAGTTYIAAYFSSAGFYVDDQGGLTGQIVNSPLTALADGASGANGLFDYSNTPKVPTSNFHGTNYWVDVVFSAITPNQLLHAKTRLTIWKKAP